MLLEFFSKTNHKHFIMLHWNLKCDKYREVQIYLKNKQFTPDSARKKNIYGPSKSEKKTTLSR